MGIGGAVDGKRRRFARRKSFGNARWSADAGLRGVGLRGRDHQRQAAQEGEVCEPRHAGLLFEGRSNMDDLEADFGEMGGYEAESNAGSLLNSLGVSDSYHQSLMKEIPSNLKLQKYTFEHKPSNNKNSFLLHLLFVLVGLVQAVRASVNSRVNGIISISLYSI